MDNLLKGIAIAIAVVGVAVIFGLLLFFNSGANVQERAAAPALPVFQWVGNPEEILAFDNSQFRWVEIVRAGKYRFQLESDSAISFGVFPTEGFQAQLAATSSPRLQPHGVCSGTDVLKIEITCELVPGDSFVMQDSRGLTDQALGAASILFGRNSTRLTAANEKNRVHLKYELWACVRNCPFIPSEPVSQPTE